MLAPYSDVVIGIKTPVNRLRRYTNSLFEILQNLDPNEDANYPSFTDLGQLEGASLSQLYLQATQALIGQVNQLDSEDSLLAKVGNQNVSQTKFAVVLTAVTLNTEFTGWLLKFIDQGRGLKHEIKRPKSLDELWGPEIAKPIQPQAVDSTTVNWLQKKAESDLEHLANSLPSAFLKMIGRLLRTTTVLNRNLYQILFDGKLLETRFGQGNSPAQELPHEVNNIINRLILLHPEKIYPAQEVVVGLSAQDQLKLYATMAGELLQAYKNPEVIDKTYTTKWGRPYTGRQLFINALRHASQHSGTLGAFFEQNKEQNKGSLY